MGIRSTGVALAAALVLGACASDDDSLPTTAPTTTTETTPETAASTAPTTTSPPTTTATLEPATFTVQPGTEQIAVLGAVPGTELTASDGTTTATGTVDEQGSLLFRGLTAGDGYVVRSDVAQSDAVTVLAADFVPPATLFADQPDLPAGGFGYIATRDGTTLSANVILPGPAEAGPYPTVVEYSGYEPSNPDSAAAAQLWTGQGFAYVGVNMRGTGCSGGSWRFFEIAQNLDGYDVVEAVAAQPWVLGNRVGMVGVSFPGISQLFVAATQPPSLAAISPLSALDDSYRSTLYPGGLLNTGFAVPWTAQRIAESGVYGQAWSQERADAGDERCAANQALRLQNPDLLAEIESTPYYTTDVGDPLAPATFVDRIQVPVFVAGAWQDEQTGGHFPAMLDDFTAAPHVYATLVNGLHTESISPPVFGRLSEFLQLYVAERVPDLTAANAIVPVLGTSLYGVGTFPPYENRFAGATYEQARAEFEAEAPIQVLFEQGSAEGLTPGTPQPAFTVGFSSWPIADAVATTWHLQPGGGLAAAPAPAGAAPAAYTADPGALPVTFFPGEGADIWEAGAAFDWRPLPAGTGVAYVTEPLDEDVVVAGSGSVDLWITSSAADTDLEVTISEVRPDGQEVYVQSGWLRASQRALDQAASTELQPVHTHREEDATDLPAGGPTEVRVELFPFAHPFRAGSQIRLTVDAPGNNRAEWEFETIADGETVTIVADAGHRSRLVLPVVADLAVPTPAPPACGSLRGQPCRAYVPASNGG